MLVSSPRLTPSYRSPYSPEVRQWTEDHPVKVLVVHSSHTGGHRSAAESLVSALEELPNVQAESFNTLSTSSETVTAGQKRLFDLVTKKVPKLRRWGFELAIKGSALPCWLGTQCLKVKAAFSPEALEHIQDFQPDIIVSTHSQTNAMLSHWKGREQIQAPVHSVPTDFLAHRMWAQKNIDHYYVAAPGVAEDLQNFGVAGDRVTVTGIPIKPSFAHPTPPPAEDLGLDPNLSTVVITGGSLGLQPYAKLVQALNERPYPMQIVCITGKNQKALDELEELKSSSRHPLIARGFVDNMQDWLGACDTVITKPGGLTCSEILALGKPMVLLNPCPGMEEHQAERLTETGVCFSTQDVGEAAATVEDLLARKVTAASQGRPDSAYAVAEQLVRSVMPK